MGKSKREKQQAYFFDNKALLALILPLVVEQLLAVLVGMADSIMIASVGEAAVSGVSLVDQIMVLLINAFAALATGGAVVAGQFLGQDRKEEACKSATQMVWFITICAIGITVLVYLGKSFILHTVFGKIDQDVMHHADVYLLIVAASIPFLALYNAGAAIFRTMGNSKVTMQISIIMNIINIGGNAILIYGFHRGTEGVAIPTLVSRITAAVIIIVMLCDEKRILHIERTCSSLARSSYSVLYRHSELMRLRRMQCRMRSHCFRSFREWQLRWRSHRLFQDVWVLVIMNRQDIIIKN